jgi:16S rRNA (cytidine1402-2'-O)-methyltransferase
MEPPYRNDAAFAEILQSMPVDTSLCVAVDLTLDAEWIRSMTIGEWRQTEAPRLNKRPCLFLLGN